MSLSNLKPRVSLLNQVNDNKDGMYVVVTGDAFTGLKLWGPFLTAVEANEWGDEIMDDFVVVFVRLAI